MQGGLVGAKSNTRNDRTVFRPMLPLTASVRVTNYGLHLDGRGKCLHFNLKLFFCLHPAVHLDLLTNKNGMNF